MRWAEVVGLETEYVRGSQLRVEWQLYELGTGELHRCLPKDDSHRTIDLPPPIVDLLAQHIGRLDARPCSCHGRRYVFCGHGAAPGTIRHPGPKLVDVARRAGTSTGTRLTSPIRCRSLPNRGPACLCVAGTPLSGPRRAGCRSPGV